MAEPFQREFLGWTRPLLPQAAERLLARAENAVADLSQLVIVVPGRRSGRRLGELLVDGASRRGCSVRPPRITTPGSLPELLYRPAAPAPPGVQIRLAWADELRSLSKAEGELLLPRPPDPDDLTGWLGLARRIEALDRELGAEMLSFEDVVKAFGTGGGFDDGPRWRILAGLQRRVRERLRKAGWHDLDEARRQALVEERVALGGELWLVGVPELSRVAKRMLSRLDGPVRVVLHAPAEESESFDPDGTLRTERWARRTLDLRDAFCVEGGPAEQADRCIRFFGTLEGSVPPDQVVVGAPDEEVVPYLAQRMDRAAVPFRVAEGRPLSRTGPFLLLRALADHLRDGRPGTLAELLRHPQVERWLEADGLAVGDAIRSFDRYRERVLPAEAGAAPLQGEIGGGAGRRAESARRRVEALLAGWRETRPLSDWGAPIVALLEELYGDRILDEARSEDQELVRFARELRRLLDEVEERDGPGVSGQVALRVVLSELADAAVPPPGGTPAVEILGWLELHLDDAPVLALTGVNDGFLPRSDVAHPFLPDGLRRSLGVPDHLARRARDAYRLTAILNARERVLLIAGRRTGRGDPLRPSPLLLQGAPAETAVRLLRHYGDEEGGEGGGGQAPPAGDRKPSRDERSGKPLAPPLQARLPPPPRPLRLRVTDFAVLIQDPYRWLLRRRAGDRWVDDDRRELDPLGFGGLAHDVLEALGRSLRDELRVEHLREGLHSELHDQVRRRHGSRLLPSVRVQVAQLEKRLETLARVEVAERERGWRTVAVEAGVPADGVPFDVDGERVYLTGRVDRIDVHPDLGWRLLDYKTSERGEEPDRRHRRGRERRWVELQLPLYRHLVSRLELDGVGGGDARPIGEAGAVGLGYYNLPRELERIGVAMADWSEGELEEADEVAREAIRPLLSGEAIALDPDAPDLRPEDALAPLLGQGILVGAEGNGDGGIDGDD